MSQLHLSAAGQSDFYLNVLSYDAPIFGEMNNGQTKSQVQYFPIKAHQPDLSVHVIFPSEKLWEQWQSWVRQNMLNTQRSNATGNPGVTINWPERNMNNLTGIIPSAKAGGMRRNYTPYATIEFLLLNSMTNTVTTFASFGTSWLGIFGGGANTDAILQLPGEIEGIVSQISTGAGVIFGGGNASVADTFSQEVNTAESLIPGLGSFGGIV